MSDTRYVTTTEQAQPDPIADPPTVRIPVQRAAVSVAVPVVPKRSGRGLLWGTLATLGIVLALILGLALGSSGQDQSSATTADAACPSVAGCAKMPNLMGMTGPQAVAVLDAIGFTGGREAFATIPAGWTVTSQDTPAGQLVALDGNMPLSFSGGPVNPPTVPTVNAATPAPSAPTEAADSAGPETSMNDGMYEAGADIAPGRYKTEGGSSLGFCAWVVYSDASKDMSNFVDGGSSAGQMYATVERGQFLEASGGCSWQLQK